MPGLDRDLIDMTLICITAYDWLTPLIMMFVAGVADDVVYGADDFNAGITKGWLAIAKLTPLSLFTSLLISML